MIFELVTGVSTRNYTELEKENKLLIGLTRLLFLSFENQNKYYVKFVGKLVKTCGELINQKYFVKMQVDQI